MKADLNLFEGFAAKYKSTETFIGNDCLIYIRVSSSKQEDNYSPEFQLEKCKDYAKRNNLNIIEVFGFNGGHESAKTDERKEFQRMLTFVKKNKKIRISYILIYSVDRFSRTGISGAYIAEQLSVEKNIKLISVLSPVDPTTPNGRMQQGMQFIFSRWDNDLRRERCIAGQISKLKAGYWVGKTPIGYINKGSGRNQDFIISDEGKLIKQAFIWKSEGICNMEILTRLKARD